MLNAIIKFKYSIIYTIFQISIVIMCLHVIYLNIYIYIYILLVNLLVQLNLNFIKNKKHHYNFFTHILLCMCHKNNTMRSFTYFI